MLRSPGLKNETVDAGQAESPDQAEGAAVLPIARVTTFRIDQLPGDVFWHSGAQIGGLKPEIHGEIRLQLQQGPADILISGHKAKRVGLPVRKIAIAYARIQGIAIVVRADGHEMHLMSPFRHGIGKHDVLLFRAAEAVQIG